LLAFAPPVEKIRPGQDELVTVVAVQIPGTGPALDDWLEGAEPALGRGAAAGQVNRECLGPLARERRQVLLGEQLAGVGGPGAGHPDTLEDVLQVGLGEMDVVLGHSL
jgi:hypothetical protein